MIKKSHRILFTVLALVISVGIVVALSFAGSKTKGPLENLFSGAGDVVQKIENNVIYQSREKKRADKLAWFQEYKSNLEVLKNPNKILMAERSLVHILYEQIPESR